MTNRAIVEASHRQRLARQALRDMIAELPDPVEYAFALPELAAIALLRSERPRAGLRAVPGALKVLRPLGLCFYRTPFLTAFGAAVYRALAGDFEG